MDRNNKCRKNTRPEKCFILVQITMIGHFFNFMCFMGILIGRNQLVNDCNQEHPGEKEIALTHDPLVAPTPKINSLFDSANNSTNDIYIITPAENPRAIDKSFPFVFLKKNTISPPIPVDKPAKTVSPMAIQIFEAINFFTSFKITKP